MEDHSGLSKSSIDVLRRLIGKAIYTIFSPNLDASGAHLAGWKLSMLLAKDSFVTFECQWRETPHFLLDSWTIDVASSSTALKIDVDSSGALKSPCTIHFYGATPISRIEVYRFSDSHAKDGVSELVEYDGTLRFICEGGKSFAIGCMLNGPGIAEYLHISEDARVIAEMTGDGVVNQVID